MILKRATNEIADEITKDDPVRPDLPMGWRVQGTEREVYYLETRLGNHRGSIGQVNAVLCLAMCEDIPISEEEILSMNTGDFVTCYSVWSNTKGAGRAIIFNVIDEIKAMAKKQYRYITMSPKTEMAKAFHLRNGAKLLQENEETYNFEYL